MPLYFFHVQDGHTSIDHEGTDLPGLKEVRKEAIMASGEMVRDNGRNSWSGAQWRMWVTDEAGATICRTKFSAE